MSRQVNRDIKAQRQEFLKASSLQKSPFLPSYKLKRSLSHLGFKARNTLMPKLGQSLFTQNTDEKGSITHSTYSESVQTPALQGTEQHITFFFFFKILSRIRVGLAATQVTDALC